MNISAGKNKAVNTRGNKQVEIMDNRPIREAEAQAEIDKRKARGKA